MTTEEFRHPDLDIQPGYVAAGRQWPEPLAPEAYHGLLGEFVRLVEPHTEADPAALLTQALAAVGNLIGRGPHFRAEADRHYTVLNVALVGKTAKGRKGTSEGRVRALLEVVDPEWALRRIKSGLSTGEGLIFEVRDATDGKNPEVGVADKRLLNIEAEMASVFQAGQRMGNTLSSVMRRAWDSPMLMSPLTKTARIEATNPHISVIGHITKEELNRVMTDTTAANGFANRFLWTCTRRSKCLPDGGGDVDISRIADWLKEAVIFARTVGEVKRDEEARVIWHEVYPQLSEGQPGMLGAVTSRAEAQVMRIALIFALLDKSTVVSKSHLLAALAVWDYSYHSAEFIFGDALGDPVADEIMRALRVHPDGMSRTEIRDHFGKNLGKGESDRALGVLAEYGRATSLKKETGGRPVEVWYAA